MRPRKGTLLSSMQTDSSGIYDALYFSSKRSRNGAILESLSLGSLSWELLGGTWKGYIRIDYDLSQLTLDWNISFFLPNSPSSWVIA